METFKYNKGGDKIHFKGYTMYAYTVKYNGTNQFTRKCSTKNTLNCPAILRTSISKTNPSVTIKHYLPVSKSEVIK